jgi:hypothetical protein
MPYPHLPDPLPSLGGREEPDPPALGHPMPDPATPGPQRYSLVSYPPAPKFPCAAAPPHLEKFVSPRRRREHMRGRHGLPPRRWREQRCPPPRAHAAPPPLPLRSQRTEENGMGRGGVEKEKKNLASDPDAAPPHLHVRGDGEKGRAGAVAGGVGQGNGDVGSRSSVRWR